MSFGKNLLFLRQINNKMTQEALADCLNVSRQTRSKWEIDEGYPEVSKLIEISKIFQVSMDDLVKADLNINNPAYSDVSIVEIPGFSFIQYVAISYEPEDDATNHIKTIAKNLKLDNPVIIGWDFPFLSQEQINVYHLRGYESALVLPEGKVVPNNTYKVCKQRKQKYAKITIEEPFSNPFVLIPNAYKIVMSHIKLDPCFKKKPEGVIPCYEKVYTKNTSTYMDIFIAVTE